MARVIKFRAWIVSQKEMIKAEKITTIPGVVAYVYSTDHDYEFQVSPSHLMQFTGLLDKNGKEIFEGDIVKTCEFIGGNFVDTLYEKFQVVFQYFGFTFKPIVPAQWTRSLMLGSDTTVEVIGNIFENPELLGA